ncbi:MAG: DNA recombination protein RmuC [bacterium]|nr:DNA recombination protein RmuC [bacterium]
MAATLTLSVLCALLIGFLTGWALHAFAAERRKRSELDALGAALQQLAAQQLESGTQRWLQLSEEKEKLLREQLSHHAQLLSTMLTPLADHIKALEQQRAEAYGRLDNAIKNVIETSLKLRDETAQLTKALSQPQPRGRWGELTLRRVVELAGMAERVDFLEQVSVAGEDERGRPDMVVHLPNGHKIVVDAKTPLDAFLQACAQTDESQRTKLLEQHACKLREMVKKLASKSYTEQIKGAADFVVLFVPGDQFLSAALACDTTLLDDALSKKVVIATPSTLLALLRAVAEGWRAADVQANLEHIKQIGIDLYKRFNTLIAHVKDIADGLSKAVKAYNNAVASMSRMLFPKLREFGELQGQDTAAMPELPRVEVPVAPPQEKELL